MSISPEYKNRSEAAALSGVHSEVAVGGFFSILAAIVVAAMAAIIKWGSHAFSTEFLMVIRFGAGLLAFLIFALIQGHGIPYRAARPLLCSLLALFWAGALFCLYFAIRFIPLPDAVLLLNTSPLFAPLINRIVLKRTETRSVWLGIILGFIGVVIILRPGAEVFQLYALIGLMAGLFISVRLVINSYLSQTESKEVISFYSLWISFVLCLGVLALSGLHMTNWEHHLFPPQDWLRPWVIFPWAILAVGALGVCCMLQPWFTAAAYEHASVGQAGPFRYLGVIFAAFLDWLCWGVVPDLPSALAVTVWATAPSSALRVMVAA